MLSFILFILTFGGGLWLTRSKPKKEYEELMKEYYQCLPQANLADKYEFFASNIHKLYAIYIVSGRSSKVAYILLGALKKILIEEAKKNKEYPI